MKRLFLIPVIGLALMVGPVMKADIHGQRSVTITAATASGSIAAGAREITFLFSSGFTGSVQGATFAGATDTVPVRITAPPEDTLALINYTVTAGNVRIIIVR